MLKPHFKLKKNTGISPFITPTSYTPLQIASLYHFPTGTGSGQKIGIIELGGGYNLSDITTYLNSLGITTTPNLTALSVDGAVNNPSDTSGANYEVVLDIEVILAVAPSATVRVYFAPNTIQGFYDGIHQAITDNCNMISISWGNSEIYWASQDKTNYNNLFQTALNAGIIIFVAAGDSGGDDGTGSASVDFPASSLYVISCGGTTLLSSGSTITSETVWDENSTSSATGGGISSFFTKPSYQNGLSVLNSSSFRGVPDVAGNADPETGYIIKINGESVVIGGTSAVAPLYAGLLARINQTAGSNVSRLMQTKIYQGNGTGFNDITSGNNGVYSAQVGFDLCTGWGSPNGNNLLTLLRNSLTASFNTNVSSGATPLTVNFTNTSNNAINFSYNFGDGTSSTLQNPSHVYNVAGTYTITLTVHSSNGNTASATKTITAISSPVASFSELTINFRDTSTRSPSSWNWNFGDGTTSTLQNPIHTYNAAGTYTVTLISINIAGSTTSTKVITLH